MLLFPPAMSLPPSPPSAFDPIVRTRFVAPKVRARILQRPRIAATLARAVDVPLTIVRAPAGYGKTTAVADHLAHAGLPYAWYHLGDTDTDPRSYLLHLVHALRTLHPGAGEAALQALQVAERSPRLLAQAVDLLSDELLDLVASDTILLLDDYDRVNTAEINAITERLVETMPPALHVVITARTTPSLRSRSRWRASGELLELSRDDLAFTPAETMSLFAARAPQPISEEAAQAIVAETEGWPIALQMLSDSMGATRADSLGQLLQHMPGPADLLFDYLADEVFLRQPPVTRQFLGESAILRRLDSEVCDAVLGTDDSAETLRALEQRSLFVAYDGSYRYHNLFRDFLLRRAGVSPARQATLHQRAAAYHAAQGDEEEAVHHLLMAGDYDAAAAVLARIAPAMAAGGRHQTLAGWLQALPAPVLGASPDLLMARGETHRLAGHFDEALEAYTAARTLFDRAADRDGVLHAIRGMSLVYLDTVRPTRAEPLLREGLRLARGVPSERRTLYLLLAENTLNAGATRVAERRLHALHRTMGLAGQAPRDPRVCVRQGAFAEARTLIQESRNATTVSDHRRAPRSHREPTALLAWCDAMLGDGVDARRHATEALDIGRLLGAPTVESVALSRLGLGWITGHDRDIGRARTYYAEALRLADRIAVPRFRVESLLGLAILEAMEGQFEMARGTASEAAEVASEVGDTYIHAIALLVTGAVLVMAGDDRADAVLQQALAGSRRCGDRYSTCLAHLWRVCHHTRRAATADARHAFIDALSVAGECRYDTLFHGTAPFAPRDIALWRGLLRRVQEHEAVGAYAREVATQLESHTDSTRSDVTADAPMSAALYVQTLGAFRVWHDGREIERSAWAREKALHLFQLLICNRAHGLHREQIIESLWPDGAPGAAGTGLRVVLSTLRNVLEPERVRGTDGRFVVRDGDVIHLARDGSIRVDADELGRRIRLARAAERSSPDSAIAMYESAMALYQGDFLPEQRYDAWAEDERLLHRRELFQAGERLGNLLLAEGEFDRVVRVAETLLQFDPLWESAYALLMEAHWQQGNRVLVARTYDRCRKRLHKALGVAPSKAITTLFERLAAPRDGRSSV